MVPPAACRLPEASQRAAQVHTPADGETADLSPGSSSYRVALSDAVMDAITLRPIGDYQLGWLAGTVGPPAQVRATCQDPRRVCSTVGAAILSPVKSHWQYTSLLHLCTPAAV